MELKLLICTIYQRFFINSSLQSKNWVWFASFTISQLQNLQIRMMNMVITVYLFTIIKIIIYWPSLGPRPLTLKILLGQTPLCWHGWLTCRPAPIWTLSLVQVVLEQTPRLVENFEYEATNSEHWITLQMFTGFYGGFVGISMCGDFKFTGFACYLHSPQYFLQGIWFYRDTTGIPYINYREIMY